MKTRILAYFILSLLIAAVAAFNFYSLPQELNINTQTPRREPRPPTISGEGSPIIYAVLDMDGGGVTDIPLKEAWIYFDHIGNGVRTSTSWIRPQNAFLGIDLNGNGVLDNGTELVGNHFKGGTAKVEDSFQALAAIDNNHDGLIDNKDPAYAKLLIWQNQDSDGICQPDEIQPIEKVGITAIRTTSSAQSASGTSITRSGIFETRTSPDGAPVTKEFFDYRFEVDTYHREFTSNIPITEEANNLPDISGSGLVRDMKEAASLSSEFAKKLTAYANTPSRGGQRQLLDDLITAWGNSSGMPDMKLRAAQNGYVLAVDFPSQTFSMLTTLEQFNGRGFFALPGEDHIGKASKLGVIIGWDGNPKHLKARLHPEQLRLLQKNYDRIKSDTYTELLLQTRFKPYVELVYDNELVKNMFKKNFSHDPERTIEALVEFNDVAKKRTELSSWGTMGEELLNRFLVEAKPSPELREFLAEFSITLPESAGQALARAKESNLQTTKPARTNKRKPITVARKPRDLRYCLAMEDNISIIRCAEQYTSE